MEEDIIYQVGGKEKNLLFSKLMIPLILIWLKMAKLMDDRVNPTHNENKGKPHFG